MSTAFERFRFSFFEDEDSARQGLDLAALRELDGKERARAEELLMAYLPDTRGVIGLGVLRAARARPALLALLEAEQRVQLADGGDWYPYGLIDLARALWQIDPDPRWPAAIIAVLTSAADPIQRQTAVEALCDVDDPATITALRRALDDSEPLVRYHAGRGATHYSWRDFRRFLTSHGYPPHALPDNVERPRAVRGRQAGHPGRDWPPVRISLTTSIYCLVRIAGRLRRFRSRS